MFFEVVVSDTAKQCIVVLQHRQTALASYTKGSAMQIHPALVTTLMAERDRELKRRAEQARTAPRGQRTVRSAPWPP
jgi:hypothetical protein